ncbi:response regulator receiver protein [Achromobacter aloeverae]|uniref:histidine kinase n=2 Tax=Achromobacter aloeverae TaxID=1750518 RepID=A0A4Q1HJ06_9BURK|nr:ATP-binding protein [Achromobacter aloeverae]RXN88232.1 response regulator receiver protein [Achromobacter aloeverae]
MSRRIRDFDWDATPLGGPEKWSQSLRSALSLCISSRFPVILWFGPDFRVLYNDAYIPFLGAGKHPHALGSAGADCWREIWPTIGPMLEGVYRTGMATWTESGQFFFDRDLTREEVFVTFTYGPILAADGKTVEGSFCPCTETTGQVVSARRLETLRELGALPLETRNVQAACGNVADVLARNRLDLPFALIYRRTGDGGADELLAATGVDDVSARQASAWPLDDVARTGRPLNVDLGERGLALSGGAWPEAATHARVVPLQWSGDGTVSGTMVLGASPRRPLNEDYRTFLDLVAKHTSTAISNAVAYEQESRRAQALAELDQAKTTFFSNVSHEFRTPLTLLLGPLEDALAQPGAPWPAERTEMMHRNALRLQKMVNGLLDFARIEAGRMQASYEPVDLAAATRDLASVFRSAIEKAGLRLNVACPPIGGPVYVDRDMYEKMVLNLLSNALKFTLRGEITVRLRETDGEVELSVEDTGIGIAADQLPRIFERFHRIEGAGGRTQEGSGIGLALVRELARLHGGRAVAQSTEGKGSRFTVSFPKGKDHLPADRIGATQALASTALTARHYVEESLLWQSVWEPAREPARQPARQPPREPDLAPPQALAANPPSTRARVLLADDNADMRDYVARLLSPHYDVEAVGDGEAALACARRRRPDLVLSDVMMPRLDGFGLLRALRADSHTQDIPIILLSARAGEEARVDGMHHGADDYLIKPFSARELRAYVDAHLKLARMRAQATAALRETDRRKDEFLATLAHELRNPLAPIRNGLGMLQRAGDGGPAATRIHGMMDRQVKHLVRLVDDLLEVSRITGGKVVLRREALDLAEVLRNAVETSRPMIDAGGHRLHIALPPSPLPLEADPVRLAQVFANLLNNAAKYTEPGGEIHLCARHDGNTALVSVRDTGMGIPPAMLPKVFDLFTQVERTYDRAQGGLGIGLTLVRSLVIMHGGQVEARSDGPGRGSEFIVRLPMSQILPVAQDTRSDDLSATTAALGRILVVDDNHDAGDSLGALLEVIGAEVHVCRDGPTALSMLKTFRPHVILLDIGMPVMDGHELARRVREDARNDGITLIALSGWGQTEDRRNSKNAGIDHHLVKPVDIDALEQLLTSLRDKKQAA